jgi:hypothetical protein
MVRASAWRDKIAAVDANGIIMLLQQESFD